MAWLKQVQDAFAAAVSTALSSSKAYTDIQISKVRNKLSIVPSYQDLPTVGDPNTTYLVSHDGSALIYDIYAYENAEYAYKGTTELNLDGYTTDAELNSRVNPIEAITQNFVIEDGKLCVVIDDEENEGETTNEPVGLDSTLQELVEAVEAIANNVEEITEEKVNSDLPGLVDNYCEENFSEWQGALDASLTEPLMAAPADKVGELKSALTSVVETIPSVQLFDRSKSTDGRMDKDGSISGVGSYVHSEKINVEGNTGRTIYFSVDDVSREANRVCAFVGENVDSSLGANTVSSYVIPETVTDIVISYSTSQTRFQAQYDRRTPYVPYGDTYKAKTDKTLTHADEIADAKAVGDRFDNEKLTGLVVSVDSDNMCNPDEVVSGLLQSDGTVNNTGGNANYDTSGYIKVEGLTNVNISAWTNTGTIVGGRHRTALFNANKQFISGSYTDDSDVNNKTITVNSAVYVRFSYQNAASKTNRGMCVEGSTVPEAFVKYHHEDQLNNDIFLNDTEKGQIPIYASNMNGKKWCPCGDSFTYGSESATFDDGIYKGKNKVYPYFIGNRTGIDVQGKFFYSGRTLAYPSDGTFDNSICNPSATYYYQNIPEDAYLVTFYLGINDHHHSTGDGEETTGVITLGTPDSVDTSTYYGAWNTVLTWLRTNRPFAHIGIIVTNGVPQEWREAQIAMARKYGVPFIDLNGDDRTPCMLRSCNANIPEAVRNAITANQRVSVSNAHPNDDAHEFESWFIESFIKTI